MTYDVKYPEINEEILAFDKDQEDRTEQGFSGLSEELKVEISELEVKTSNSIIGLENELKESLGEATKNKKQNLSLQSGWSNVGSSFGLARVNMVNEIVNLSGLISGGEVGSTITVLPAIYRFSSGVKRFSVASRATSTVTSIEINSSGIVKLLAGDNTNVDLSSITYIKD